MSSQLKIPKEILLSLYEKDNLTTFQIAEKFGCCQATVWKKLKEFNIRLRLPGVKRVKLTSKQLEDLYLSKKLSTWQIEKELKIPRGTIHRKLGEFGIPLRNRSESHIIYPKSDFSGDLVEKAYLIGFRLGDLGVRKVYPNSEVICVASGSTINEQICLMKTLFENYGKVWTKKTKNKKINFQIFLNSSFEFLIDKSIPEWVEKDKKLFFSFLAGFIDAEGSIILSKNRARFSLGNYDYKLLFWLADKLPRFGIPCQKPTSDNRKGKENSQGYKYSSNYWSLRMGKREDLLRLLLEIRPYLKHKKKIKDLNIALVNIKQRT
jgi:hypothetical protein